MPRTLRHYYAREENYPQNYIHVFRSQADRNAWTAEDPARREDLTATDPQIKRSTLADNARFELMEDGHFRYTQRYPTHYIGHAGLSGYIPSFCEPFETRRGAAESLCTLHDLSEHGRVFRELMRTGHAYLPKDAGNEYAEIDECDCNEPWIHSEDDSPDNWPDYPQPENGD